MAYKYKINPVTGKLDLVGTEGGGITNITSEDGTITVTTSGNTVDLTAPSLKMLEGYACGFGSSGGSGYAKFCDLYWTNLNGAVSSLPQFHVNYHKFGGGGGIYYTADLCLIFGNEGSGVQVCHAIIENEIAYADSADIPSTTIEQYRPSNIIKVDYIKTATRGGQGDPKTDIGFGHAVICCHWDWTNTNVHLHPLSSRAILYNNSNLCYFELNPECVVGRCSNYTVQGTIQPAKVAGGSSQPQSSIIYKGTIGTGGTITTLPTASSENAGWQYKVITAGTYSGIEANINDSFISNGSTWTLAKGSEDISKIGDLNDLTTSVKTSVVAAVNEVNGKVGSKLENVSTETTTLSEDLIEFTKDDGTLVGKITPTGAEFNSVKVNNKEVLTEHQDISGKANKSYVDTELAKKQNTLTAGTNVTIENNVISASGGVGDLPIVKEATGDEDDNIVFSTDANKKIMEVSANGVKVSSITDLDGNPIKSPEFALSFLPSTIYGVVGMTQQLFVRGMNYSFNPYRYYNRFVSSIGKPFKRYLEITPASSGDVTIAHKIQNDELQYIASSSSTLKVCAKPTSSPSSAINVLCVGASTTANGEWADELKRLLTTTSEVDYTNNSAPKGVGLSNINFVGRLSKRNVKCEGAGGWTWKTYTTAGVAALRFVVSGVDSLSIGALYSYTDVNGVTGSIEVREVNITDGSGNIRCVIQDASKTKAMPVASGTLTKISGNGDASITYSSVTSETYSPFWDSTNSQVSFVDYANRYCNDKIDVCIVFLTPFNSGIMGDSDLSGEMENQKKFIDALHRDFPSCKILLVPNILCSTEYGVEYNFSSSNMNYINAMKMYFRWGAMENDFVANETYSSYCYLVNSMAEIDSENAFPTSDKTRNTRTSETEKIGTNGVHPTERGYMMLADSVFRCFCNVIL